MKGRPKVIPRIEDLEKAVLELAERVAKLELIRAYQLKETDYKPLFQRWPEVNGR